MKGVDRKRYKRIINKWRKSEQRGVKEGGEENKINFNHIAYAIDMQVIGYWSMHFHI